MGNKNIEKGSLRETEAEKIRQNDGPTDQPMRTRLEEHVTKNKCYAQGAKLAAFFFPAVPDLDKTFLRVKPIIHALFLLATRK